MVCGNSSSMNRWSWNRKPPRPAAVVDREFGSEPKLTQPALHPGDARNDRSVDLTTTILVQTRFQGHLEDRDQVPERPGKAHIPNERV